MPTRRSAFKQADLTRALRAGRDAGLCITRYGIAPDGNIVIATDAAKTPANSDGSNEWDEVLK